MTQALPQYAAHDVQTVTAVPPSAAPAPVEADPLPARVMSEASIWKRLGGVRMSEVERRAAVDALLLGRDIGRMLLGLERAMRRRWVYRASRSMRLPPERLK